MARPPSMETFDAYFQRADLDRDGRISGPEAVAFFQGSNLPKPILAQIWMHADQNRTGFLGRQEFHNALRLVTVAQSGRELTPDIVKAALFGPAAAKIPPPQINPVPGSVPANSVQPPVSQVGPTAAHNAAFRQQAPPTSGMTQQFFPSPDNQFIRPTQASAGVSSMSMQGPGMGVPGAGGIPGPQLPSSNVQSMSTDWIASRQPNSQVPNRGISPPSMVSEGINLSTQGSIPSIPSRPPGPSGVTPGVSLKLPDPVKDSKALAPLGDGFGGDVFSATPKQAAPTPTFSGSMPNTSAIVPVTAAPQPAAKQGQPDPFAGMVNLPTSTSQMQRPPSGVRPNQSVTTQSAPGLNTSGVAVGAPTPASSQPQIPWPRMTPQNITKYTNVFVEVDTDRDGKITGEQARNLFLSWRLPREVLKQVWDLSDQDNDSMLSLREFCTALYLMERYREGRPLPEVLPDSVKFDQLLPISTQAAPAYGGTAWRPNPGFPQQGMSAARPPVAPSSAPRPPVPVQLSHQSDVRPQTIPPKSRVPTLEKHLVNQLSSEEQSSLNSKLQEATDADKKVGELETEILDSREKIEFYRTKMQELVLYKSRCDNRLNEITEKVLADRREVESLAKKYEEKYKQVGDVASKLTVEEATFRDVQERKMELYNAIVKMEQGGSVDGLLQVRADRIQSDLEELVKALNERCKKYGLRVKPTALVELPFGWQPGIQEGAADWDEDWDKFEDEGFVAVKELTVDVPNITTPAKPKSNLVWNEKFSPDEPFEASPTVDRNSEKPSSPVGPSSTVERAPENGSAYAQSEDGSARSPPASPLGRSFVESPSQDYSPSRFGKDISVDASPRGKDTHSDHGAAESTISGDKFTDDHSWGPTFDANDDADSVWGFGSKEADFDRSRDSFFGGSDFGLNPIRTTDSPTAESVYQKKSFFADSVPGTPLFNSSSPPRFSQASEDHHSFDSFSRFDSFNMHDSGLFAPRESLARFDSIRSTRDSTAFTSFDDSDPFGSTGPFKSLDNQTPRRNSDNWSAF
ncbi:hypothetical protein H6P81_018423 [Aristolochia fimbriata]|uniref:Uncharacterized protein n=1 Tax=Aristolochia fimbriata TaxID=158543 RepID=A0AAV7E2X8_ARIFI|nr:hypothetical protein H6P81_018423 [Aristolochia fimbriata]